MAWKSQGPKVWSPQNCWEVWTFFTTNRVRSWGYSWGVFLITEVGICCPYNYDYSIYPLLTGTALKKLAFVFPPQCRSRGFVLFKGPSSEFPTAIDLCRSGHLQTCRPCCGKRGKPPIADGLYNLFLGSGKLVPSGKLTVCYWNWQFIVDLPIENGEFP